MGRSSPLLGTVGRPVWLDRRDSGPCGYLPACGLIAASAVHAHDVVAPVNGCHSSGECANLDRRTAAFLNVLHDIDGARADLTADCTRRVRLDANAIAWFEIADAIDIVAVVHRRGASAADGDHFAAVGLDHHPPVSGVDCSNDALHPPDRLRSCARRCPRSRRRRNGLRRACLSNAGLVRGNWASEQRDVIGADDAGIAADSTHFDAITRSQI